ncbi:MAG: histidine kinase dimerization/phosphoacceptor domain -containing protein [Ferruginibacter sp.]
MQKSKSDSERVNLLLEASLVYVTRAGMEKNDFDSALLLVDQANNLSRSINRPDWQARCFRVYSQLYRENNETVKGRNYIDNAIAISTKYDAKENLGDAYMELLRYYNVYSDSGAVAMIKYAELAKGLYKQSGNKLKQAITLKHLGDFYSENKEDDSIALKCLYESLSIYQSVGYKKLQGVYDLIGIVLLDLGDYNQALKYALLAMETAERLKTDHHELCTIYNRVGEIYQRLDQDQKALIYFIKSFPLALEYKDTLSANVVAANIMANYYKHGKQKELIVFLERVRYIVYERGSLTFKANYISKYILAYLLTGNIKKAEPLVSELIQMVGNETGDLALRPLCRALIPYYIATKQYKEMYKYLPVYERISTNRNNLNNLSDNYLWWFKADSALGNYTNAITHYKLYKEASDSLHRASASREINQLQIEYETLKKDQAIASKESNILLLTKQAKLQEEQLRQTRILKNLTFGLVALLLIIVGLLFNRYRLKQRTNKKLEVQQIAIGEQNVSLRHLVNEKDWLVKEIHHRVKNNLQTVMGLLGTQAGYLKNEAAVTAITDSQRRIQSMSLIHRKLYQSNNLSAINMPDYIHELIDFLSDSFNTSNQVRFNLDIEPIQLDLEHCIPLGLILNEAITNSFKYAFPGNAAGIISISFKHESVNYLLLTIMDNGTGLPTTFDINKSDSMGMNLMRGLSKEIGAKFTIRSENGTHVAVSFAYDPETANGILSINNK